MNDLQATLAAVESGTALSTIIQNSPNVASSKLSSLYTVLSGQPAVPGSTLTTLQGAITNVNSSASAVSAQISTQMTNLLLNIQTYNSLNDMRLANGEITQAQVGSDITTYFGSIMLPNYIIDTAQNRINRIQGLDANSVAMPGCQETVTNQNVQTVIDEVNQLAGYASTMANPSFVSNENAALATAAQRLNNLATANIMLDYLQIPATYPILDIVKGTGFAPVVANAATNIAAASGFDVRGTYATTPASDEAPIPPFNPADPTP